MASNKEELKSLPYYKQLLELLDTNDELKKTSLGVFRQMAWAASGGFGGFGVGGLVAGPPGAIVGGIAGSVIGYCRSGDNKSMIDVLQVLTDEEKQNLVNEVQTFVGSTTIEDLLAFVGSQAQREALINLIHEFVTSSSDECNSSNEDTRNTNAEAPPPYNPEWQGQRVPSAVEDSLHSTVLTGGHQIQARETAATTIQDRGGISGKRADDTGRKTTYEPAHDETYYKTGATSID